MLVSGRVHCFQSHFFSYTGLYPWPMSVVTWFKFFRWISQLVGFSRYGSNTVPLLLRRTQDPEVLTANSKFTPWKFVFPKKETGKYFQPSIFSCKNVSGRGGSLYKITTLKIIRVSIYFWHSVGTARVRRILCLQGCWDFLKTKGIGRIGL